MELFPAADEEQFEFIKREIDSSDYYVVIIAGRYGSVAEDGVSYTEKEYDYAVAKGKPVLAFLHRDIMKLPGEKLEDSDKGKEKLMAFREKASKRRLVNFYSNPDELKSQVLGSLTDLFDLNPKQGWVRAWQTPRESLEEINQLQKRVIQLEAENKELRLSQDDASNILSSGEETVKWTLSIENFVFGQLKPAIDEIDVEASWNELLLLTFPGGSSYVQPNDVRLAIFQMILGKAPREIGDERYWQQASLTLQRMEFPSFGAIPRIFTDIHRQFTGLGWIREDRESGYRKAPWGDAEIPYTTTLWYLTPKGERYVALTRGYRKSAT